MIYFVHEIAGCDTTSRLFMVGKAKTLEKIDKGAIFQQTALTFCSKVMPDRNAMIEIGVQ